MQHRFSPAAARVLVALALALAAASCTKRVTAVDPEFTTPEGTFSPDARLLVWAETANILSVYADINPPGPDPGDVLQAEVPYSQWGPGTVHGLIVDRTSASEYQAFRTEDNGGVRQFNDFTVPKTRTWLDTQWEAYHFADVTPPAPRRYLARGIIDRMTSPTSPLSNEGLVGDGTVENMTVSAIWWPMNAPTNIANRGRIKLHWSLVNGAERYLIQIYTFGPASTADQRIRSGVPAPLYDGWVHDYYVAFAPPTVDLLFAGDSTRTDIEVVTQKRVAVADLALARVSALDANGRMIGTTPGAPVMEFNLGGEGTYGIYSINAEVVRDTAPATAAGLLRRDVPTLDTRSWFQRPGEAPTTMARSSRRTTRALTR